MNRRRYLVSIICGGTAFLSGCINVPGAEGGLVQALELDAPPNASITDASDDRIQDVAPIQEALEKAGENSTADIKVSEKEYHEVAQALSELPWYEWKQSENSSGTPIPSGVYIQYQNRTYVVVLTPYCSDSLIFDSRSDRGEYGWGGCIKQ